MANVGAELLRVEGSAAHEDAKNEAQARFVRRTVKALYPEFAEGVSCLTHLMKTLNEEAPSNQRVDSGMKTLPFDFAAATKFKIHNTHHSTCIDAAKNSLVGLGHFLTEEQIEARDLSPVNLALDPLCRISWHTTLLQLAEDYVQTGNAYLEVVRRDSSGTSPITGLHHIPSNLVRVVVENRVNHHFKILGGQGLNRDSAFPAFGDLDDFMARRQVVDDSRISEIIHIPDPSSMSRWYGVPPWLAAVAPIELNQAVLQHQFDFHVNRGVPEFIMLLLGNKIDAKTWKKVENMFQAYIGVGNSHKASVMNIPDPNVEVRFEKLAMDGIANGTFFRDMTEALATIIVSAHRTPPAIGGILIPGKMGAANEGSNAIMMYQSLKIGPMQTQVESVFGCTLGNERFNGGLGLTPKDFEFRTIVDELGSSLKKLQPMDTMGRMRDELPNAVAEGRDLEDGLEKSQEDRAARIIAKALGGF